MRPPRPVSGDRRVSSAHLQHLSPPRSKPTHQRWCGHVETFSQRMQTNANNGRGSEDTADRKLHDSNFLPAYHSAAHHAEASNACKKPVHMETCANRNHERRKAEQKPLTSHAGQTHTSVQLASTVTTTEKLQKLLQKPTSCRVTPNNDKTHKRHHRKTKP